MSNLIAFINLSLDGVMQAPGRPDEDTRGGFQDGGWGAPFGAMQSQAAAESLPKTGSLLMGRRTYEDFYAVWPKRTDSPFSAMLTNMPKYVASTTLHEPLDWENSTLLTNPISGSVRALKAQDGQGIMIMGSGVLIQSLMAEGLVDLFVLLIHPLVLGSGRRLFPENGIPASLQLNSAKTTPNGVIVARYEK